MKLIQYRFEKASLSRASFIGEKIQTFFNDSKDVDLKAVYPEGPKAGSISRKPILIADLSAIIADALINSHSITVDYTKSVSLKSAATCRFVVVEDDGLVRLCYSNDDEILCFTDIPHEMSDISHWLIETDFFDFL